MIMFTILFVGLLCNNVSKNKIFWHFVDVISNIDCCKVEANNSVCDWAVPTFNVSLYIYRLYFIPFQPLSDCVRFTCSLLTSLPIFLPSKLSPNKTVLSNSLCPTVEQYYDGLWCSLKHFSAYPNTYTLWMYTHRTSGSPFRPPQLTHVHQTVLSNRVNYMSW